MILVYFVLVVSFLVMVYIIVRHFCQKRLEAAQERLRLADLEESHARLARLRDFKEKEHSRSHPAVKLPSDSSENP